jgi:hypothetical protein
MDALQAGRRITGNPEVIAGSVSETRFGAVILSLRLIGNID